MENTDGDSVGENVSASRAQATYVYGGKTFVVPAFTAPREAGLVLRPDPSAALRRRPLADLARRPPRPRDQEHARWPTSEEILGRLGCQWDAREFESVHPPLVVGDFGQREDEEEEEGDDDGERAALRRTLERPGGLVHQRVLDMPIKFPGSHEYRLPAELGALAPLVRRVLDFEYAVNEESVLDTYCYLTLDQGVVPAGQMQRNEGCHVDGFQGARISPKLRSDHSYIVSNVLPTIFYLQPFEVKHLDPTRHNFFLDFDRQAKEENAWRPEPLEIVLMDAFCVHKGEIATQDTFRTFMRMSYTVRIFDRLGNGHNPMFDYSWEMVPRQVQSTLSAYVPDRRKESEGKDIRPETHGTHAEKEHVSSP